MKLFIRRAQDFRGVQLANVRNFLLFKTARGFYTGRFYIYFPWRKFDEVKF